MGKRTVCSSILLLTILRGMVFSGEASRGPYGVPDTGRQGADYLVVTHHSFVDHLGPLVDLRDSLGLSVVVLDDTTIYQGSPYDSCTAIKDVITDAYLNWDPAPSFVLLVGDAVEGGGAGDLIPSKLFPKFSYWYAGGCTHHCSDNWYVEIEGDDYVPELAIGRLPVATAGALDTVIQKIIAYEQGLEVLDTVMIVVGGEYVNSVAGTFDSIPAACNPLKLYGTEIDADSCHAAIISTYRAGCDLVFGLCHGCYPTTPSHTWAARFGGVDMQIVFSDDDFDSLSLANLCPILFEWG